MEATYTPGDGIAVGAGSRWLLLATDPGTPAVESLWTLLTGPRPDTTAAVEAVEAACGADATLVLVDLTVGAQTSTTRGSGRHTTRDGVHTLDLGGLPDGAPADTARRLVGGVVGASRLVLRPAGPVAARAPAPAPAVRPATAAPATAAGAAAPTGLIDAVPPGILAASAPPPAPTPVTDPPEDAAAVHTDEPSPDSRRIGGRMVERMGSTVRRDLTGPPAGPPVGPPGPPPPPPPPVVAPDGAGADHDGHTTYRPAGTPPPPPPPPASHLQQTTGETVLAVHCPAGHVTAAYSPRCRVCHEPVPPQAPHRMPRPRLGTLHLPDGERVPLDRGVVLGRQPEAVPGGAPWPHLVRLPHDATFVSRSHLSVVLDGWLVIATDLGSRGGTTLRVPGRAPQRIRGHEQYVWEPGQVLDLADCYEIVYEVA